MGEAAGVAVGDGVLVLMLVEVGVEVGVAVGSGVAVVDGVDVGDGVGEGSTGSSGVAVCVLVGVLVLLLPPPESPPPELSLGREVGVALGGRVGLGEGDWLAAGGGGVPGTAVPAPGVPPASGLTPAAGSGGAEREMGGWEGRRVKGAAGVGGWPGRTSVKVPA